MRPEEVRLKEVKSGWLVERLTEPSNLSEVEMASLNGVDHLAEVKAVVDGPIRSFSTGATRDLDKSKIDYEGFISPLVIEAFGRYMHKNRNTAAGWRASDNWQKGIPLDAYMKSGWRHFFDWWCYHRDLPTKENLVMALCGLLFNAQGYLHEILKANPTLLEESIKE